MNRTASFLRVVLAVVIPGILLACAHSSSEEDLAETRAPEQPRIPPDASSFAGEILAALETHGGYHAIHDWPALDSLPGRRSQHEWVPVSAVEDLACDGFRYTLIVDHAEEQFWVLQSGGFAGVATFHGPAFLVKGEVLPLRWFFDPAWPADAKRRPLGGG